MIDVLSLDNMKKSDKYQCDIEGSKSLMYKAGLGIYNNVNWHGKTLICAGSGNNAGDGYVIAKLLKENNYDVDILRISDKFSIDGKYYYDMCKALCIKDVNLDVDFNDYDIIVDSLLGTGFNGELKDSYKEVISRINASNAYVVSADINSGLNGDSGMADIAVISDITFSIGSYKSGHFLNMAKDYIKNKMVLDIGITPLDKPYKLIEKNDLKVLFPKRLNYSNKGSYGYVALVGGSIRYSGAIRLAQMANASMRSGAGVVFLATISSLADVILPNILESTFYPLDEDMGYIKFNKEEFEGLLKCKAIAFGMGIGNTVETKKSLEFLLKEYDKNLIIDADGLNALSEMDNDLLKTTKAKIILTPHIKEFSRLIKKPINEILENPISYALSYAKENNVILLLKGPSTIITDGCDLYIVDKGTSGMATAGSGDVLSGILSAICAYDDNLLLRVASGAYINGYAGELAERMSSATVMVSSDTALMVKNAILDIEKN